MKRLHIHIKTTAFDESVRFYSTLFSMEPAVLKSDYAKWMPNNPAINLAISKSGSENKLEHLGIQVETAGELTDLMATLEKAGSPDHEGETVCCYAKSTKSWITDPAGLTWEAFLTHGSSETYRTVENACCS